MRTNYTVPTICFTDSAQIVMSGALLTLRHGLSTPDVPLADLHKPPSARQQCQRGCHHAAGGEGIQYNVGPIQMGKGVSIG